MIPRMTASVVTWNSERLVPSLADTLNALLPICRVIVSDNASTDGTADLLKREVPGARVMVNPRNGGFGYGNNRVLEVCDTEFLLLLNSDASISRESLEMLLETLLEDPGLSGIQPLIRLWGWPSITLSAGCSMNEHGFGYDMDFMHFQSLPDPVPREVPCLTAALSLYRTDAVRRAGGFDERMFMYFEDIDLSLRLRSLGGGLLFQPGAEAEHMTGASSGRSAADRWELRSAAYLARKYLGGSGCRLPRYWTEREWRTRIHAMLHGLPWFWRPGAVAQAVRTPVDPVALSGELLSWVLAPRPLRMPRPRPPDGSEARLPGDGQVRPGPGWRDGRTGPWGFGCLKVPSGRGRLHLRIVSCDIPGSVALWSGNRFLCRTFVGGGAAGLTAELPEGEESAYLVPDRPEQTLELENVHYELL
ncbi:MAG: glycosyltransferase family 2 protein [Candidatus Fermentibacteraceae bacterium]|nr:glycosyltransferase family 2 protein [Candidatus Fermentibacteraceae bacterium]MBN2607629.1 glycosyltransferase family 2 protein [Candidatus Fermentibacteraceae bacterium]